MNHKFDFNGKVSIQEPRNYKCGKCSADILRGGYLPDGIAQGLDKETFFFYNTLSSERDIYIYQTKSGRAIMYCSKYCRDKHNHRFR